MLFKFLNYFFHKPAYQKEKSIKKQKKERKE